MTIHDILDDNCITQSRLSRDLGIPLRTVQDWAGERRNPPEWTLRLIDEHYKRLANPDGDDAERGV